jgi:hypothetical protein
MKTIFAFCALSAILILTFTFLSQTAKAESLEISTYYPSPNGVFDRMEVKGKLIVGNITDSNTPGITSINDVQNSQVYLTDSLILGLQPSGPNSPKEGQIFYNSTTKTMECYEGAWQQIGR